MAELDEIEKMEKAFGDATMAGERAEQTGSTAESEAKTSEQRREEALAAAKARYAHLKIDTGPIIEEGAKSKMKDAVYLEVGGYSITPKTFQSRTFFSDEEPSGDEEKESLAGLSSSDPRAAEEPIHPPRSLTYVDEFAFGSNAVVRFGINSELPELSGIIMQEGITLSSEKSISVSTKNYTSEMSKMIVLSSVEINLLNQAVERILSADSCNAVVIDIFERENVGSIGSIKTERGKLKTHSVVLYKNSTSEQEPAVEKPPGQSLPEILVIDPSNFLFSSHLFNYQHSSGIVIKTCHTGLQIYRPLKEPGPNYDQSRDCIDLSIKIAFGLNNCGYRFEWNDLKTDRGIKCAVDSIKECSLIQNLSNQVDKANIFPKLPLRTKQTSDIDLVHLFCEVQKELKQNFNVLTSVDKGVMQNIKMACATSLNSNKAPTEVITDLLGQNASCIEHIRGFADHAQERQDCLGAGVLQSTSEE